MRFILEGEWLGYRPSQDRIVHREVVTLARAKRLAPLHRIVFTDGTSLRITIREAGHREIVHEVNGYGSLIREAEATGLGIVAVADLCAVRKETAHA